MRSHRVKLNGVMKLKIRERAKLVIPLVVIPGAIRRAARFCSSGRDASEPTPWNVFG